LRTPGELDAATEAERREEDDEERRRQEGVGEVGFDGTTPGFKGRRGELGLGGVVVEKVKKDHACCVLASGRPQGTKGEATGVT
jgi:hypothetical protein